ncbi:MAG: orotidine-5'-phosphate decarboxylase [Flavobacteriaceae bacterium]|nr:orotidine-5'-phosphate decarboxylase [Flavobacteriaceae bacterium]
MTTETLVKNIKSKKSFLCIGLDPDLTKIPKHLLSEEDPIFEFNKQLIDATNHLTVAYKSNTAFYEAYGVKGWVSLEKTINYLNINYPEIFTIADAKRGDIGNTSTKYAEAFFTAMNFDAITVSPYMGIDSVEPFLNFDDKFTILLALTSNIGSYCFQEKIINDMTLFEQVLKESLKWKNAQNLMYVIGATKAESLKKVRAIVPNHFLLIPGVGAQGGSLEEVCENGLNQQIGLLINSSRDIIYAGNQLDFALKSQEKAKELQSKMAEILSKNGLYF